MGDYSEVVVVRDERNRVACPYCGGEISYLLSYSKVYEAYRFDGEDYVRDESADVTDVVGETSYVCPRCREVVALDEDLARKLLGKEVDVSNLQD